MEHITHNLAHLAKQIPGLEHLPRKVFQTWQTTAVRQSFNPGQVIYLAGQEADAAYLLEKGWVRASRLSCAGREQGMLFLAAVEMFGDVAMLSPGGYPCTVVALEGVEVWRIPKAAFYEALKRHADLAVALAQRMSMRVRYYVDLVEDLGLCDVETRVARTLLRYMEFREGHWRIPRRGWTTIANMAIRLGTVREVLSRALRRLESRGLLEVHRHEIIVLDPEGLARQGHLTQPHGT